MSEDFWFDSCGAGKIHVCRWMPEGEPKAVFQIVHGIAEVAERYDAFAQVLAQRGFVVVADDHMGHGESVGEGDTKGYFTGGWFSAVADSYHLLELTKAEYPEPSLCPVRSFHGFLHGEDHSVQVPGQRH